MPTAEKQAEKFERGDLRVTATEVGVIANKALLTRRALEDGVHIPPNIREYHQGDTIPPDAIDDEDYWRLISIGAAERVEDLEERANIDAEVAKLRAKADAIERKITEQRQASIAAAEGRREDARQRGEQA